MTVGGKTLLVTLKMGIIGYALFGINFIDVSPFKIGRYKSVSCWWCLDCAKYISISIFVMFNCQTSTKCFPKSAYTMFHLPRPSIIIDCIYFAQLRHHQENTDLLSVPLEHINNTWTVLFTKTIIKINSLYTLAHNTVISLYVTLGNGRTSRDIESFINLLWTINISVPMCIFYSF